TVLERAVAAVREPLGGVPCVLVTRPAEVARLAAQWELLGVKVVAGGARRQDSVRCGFAALAPTDDEIVLIHDGARPFVPPVDVQAVVAAAAEVGAALLVAPVVDTVKRVNEDGSVAGTVARERLARALTPQAFRANVLRHAWATAGEGEWTDEAAIVETVGGEVRAVPGDPRNVKVTRPEDLRMVAGLFPATIRVGQGIDVHPFAPGRRLVLCGVELPGETGLAGHSDADVALHAVVDAILGAAGAGDIGEHFPPSEEQWRDAASERFVQRALELAAERGLRPAHCDVTILAERPRIAPHRERLRARLAELLGLELASVNLKATTTERLGFIGRGEGIAALALVTLEPA
ncbi:MAG: 2-C-methyl-D-erythritol 2,4-cyclodiphosphate synthase, partial [Acidobacteriota bacterium]